MRTEKLTESRATRLSLSPQEAEALNRLGSSLASDLARPGFEDEEEPRERSIVRCRPTGEPGTFEVRVSEAVGVIAVLGQLQIEVRPKIPTSHFVYLMEAAEALPRLDPQQTLVDPDDNLLELIAKWFVLSSERLLRRGLVKGYASAHDFLKSKRGRLNALPTARAYYSGKLGFDCDFDEFTNDVPLNRVVKGGATVVVRNPSLDRSLRRRALRVASRMDDVSRLGPGDMRAERDRSSRHYSPTLPLAKQLIRSEGRSLRSGVRDTWSFLIRTPEMIEEGVRNVLHRHLGHRWKVDRGHVKARGGSGISFNPDLEFAGGLAVGDVKYKLQGADWNRGDLNQIVTFVAAYDSRHGAVFSFREEDRLPLPQLLVGAQTIRSITWPSDPGVEPGEAANSLVSSARAWLEEVSRTVQVAA